MSFDDSLERGTWIESLIDGHREMLRFESLCCLLGRQLCLLWSWSRGHDLQNYGKSKNSIILLIYQFYLTNKRRPESAVWYWYWLWISEQAAVSWDTWWAFSTLSAIGTQYTTAGWTLRISWKSGMFWHLQLSNTISISYYWIRSSMGRSEEAYHLFQPLRSRSSHASDGHFTKALRPDPKQHTFTEHYCNLSISHMIRCNV